jgi:hypothetical protein
MTFAEWLIESKPGFTFLDPSTPPEAPNILWITGMNSQGWSARELAIRGYNVKQVGTTNNYFAAGLGRIKRYPILNTLIGKTADSLGSAHMASNAQKHDSEMKGTNFVPDVVIGASQGGAVAMQVAHEYPNTKFVLIAPAWKIFNSNPQDLPKDTIVLQGGKDIQVPPQDSEELKKYGFKVFFLKDEGHQIPVEYIQKAVDAQLMKTRAAHLIPSVLRQKELEDAQMKNQQLNQRMKPFQNKFSKFDPKMFNPDPMLQRKGKLQ